MIDTAFIKIMSSEIEDCLTFYGLNIFSLVLY